MKLTTGYCIKYLNSILTLTLKPDDIYHPAFLYLIV